MPLKQTDKKKITSNYKEIVEDLNLDSILDSLISKEVISLDDRQRIEAKHTQKDKNREFIQCLIKAPEKGFELFINELREDPSYKELAEKIKNTVVHEELPETIERWIGKSGLPPEKSKKQLADLNMLHFSRAINPHNLNMIAPFFDFSAVDVQCVEYRNTRSPEAACHELLVNWKNRLGNKATPENLLSKMFEAWLASHESINEEKILHAINGL